jgi:hypothetical protein
MPRPISTLTAYSLRGSCPQLIWVISPKLLKTRRLVVEEGVVHRLKENKAGLMNVGAFYSAHYDYLQALIKDLDSWGLSTCL